MIATISKQGGMRYTQMGSTPAPVAMIGALGSSDTVVVVVSTYAGLNQLATCNLIARRRIKTWAEATVDVAEIEAQL